MRNFDEKMKNILSKDFEVPMSTQETIKNALDKERKITKKENKLFKVASVVLVLLLVGGLSTKAYIDFKEIHKDFSHANVTIEDFENINMDYVDSKDGKVALKLEKLLISDNDIMAIVKIKFNEKMVFDSNAIYPLFEYGIFDENKVAYTYYEGIIGGETSGIIDFYKRNDIEYTINNVFETTVADRGGLGYTDITEDGFTLILESSTETDEFPVSDKLYFDMGNIGYRVVLPDKKIKQEIISNDYWLLEIDIPENLKDRKTIEYEIKDEPETICLEAFNVTKTSTTLRLENRELEWIFNPVNGEKVTENMNNNIAIVDENGVEYFAKGMSYSDGRITGIYDLNIEKLTEKMYLKMYVGGEAVKLELIKNK